VLLLAHISDIHIGGQQGNTDRVVQVVEYLNALRHPVDAVLVTGDIADHGEIEEYRIAREVLNCGYPVLTCPGNHDVRTAYCEAFLGQAYNDGPVNQVIDTGMATFALCDSSIPGKFEGLLDDTTLEWLDQVLASGPPEQPAFVCFHHPPVSLHSPELDAIRLGAAERLARLLARHRRVAAILCGHAHTAASSAFAGLPVRVAPGIASTLHLPWENGPLLDGHLPPALAFHVLGDDQRLTTHYRVLT
jgi:3',5'-cyclic-AMP phosphodiesterase